MPGKADCKEIGGERVDVPVVQKPPSEVAATACKEGILTKAPASEAERVEVGSLWGETPEGWEMEEKRGGRRMG